MMTCEMENRKAKSISTVVPVGTADLNQKLGDSKMTSLKNKVPFGSTSSTSSLGNAISGIKGYAYRPYFPMPGYELYPSVILVGVDGIVFNQRTYLSTGCLQQSVLYASEALPCNLWTSSTDDVQNETTNSSSTTKGGPELGTSENSNDFDSTDRNGNFTGKSPMSMPDTKKAKKIPKRVPHLQFNFSVVGLPRAYNPRKSPSLASQKGPIFPHTDHRPTGRAQNVNNRPISNDKFNWNAEPEMSPELSRGASLASQKQHTFPPTNCQPTGRALSVNNRPMSRDYLNRNTEPEMFCGPSLATQKRHSFPSTNCRPIGRALSVKNRPMSRGDLNCSTELEMLPELTCGPRCYDRNFQLEPTTVKQTDRIQTFGFSICRAHYNLSDFQTEYENAKFYVIKSFNEDDIHKSIKYNVWTSTRYGNKKLNAAFCDAEANSSETSMKCPVFLFFSVNGSGQFVGVAEMIGPVDFNKDMSFWKLDKYNGFFPVKWHILKDVPSSQFRYIILPNNDNRPVTYSRDTQEVGLKQGMEMLKIFKRYLAKTSLLDDYDFYVKREKLSCAQSSTKDTIRQRELYSMDNYQMTSQGVERMKSGGINRAANASSLINLTGNLSLNPSGK